VTTARCGSRRGFAIARLDARLSFAEKECPAGGLGRVWMVDLAELDLEPLRTTQRGVRAIFGEPSVGECCFQGGPPDDSAATPRRRPPAAFFLLWPSPPSGQDLTPSARASRQERPRGRPFPLVQRDSSTLWPRLCGKCDSLPSQDPQSPRSSSPMSTVRELRAATRPCRRAQLPGMRRSCRSSRRLQ
jgi:hypothetical protein